MIISDEQSQSGIMSFFGSKPVERKLPDDTGSVNFIELLKQKGKEEVEPFPSPAPEAEKVSEPKSFGLLETIDNRFAPVQREESPESSSKAFQPVENKPIKEETSSFRALQREDKPLKLERKPDTVSEKNTNSEKEIERKVVSKETEPVRKEGLEKSENTVSEEKVENRVSEKEVRTDTKKAVNEYEKNTAKGKAPEKKAKAEDSKPSNESVFAFIEPQEKKSNKESKKLETSDLKSGMKVKEGKVSEELKKAEKLENLDSENLKTEKKQEVKLDKLSLKAIIEENKGQGEEKVSRLSEKNEVSEKGKGHSEKIENNRFTFSFETGRQPETNQKQEGKLQQQRNASATETTKLSDAFLQKASSSQTGTGSENGNQSRSEDFLTNLNQTFNRITKDSANPEVQTEKFVSREAFKNSLSELVQKARVNIVENGRNSAQISLYPRELGKMTLNISVLQDKVEGRVLVESEAIKNILLSEINGLKTDLKLAGLNLENIQIDVRQEGDFLSEYAENRERSDEGEKSQSSGKATKEEDFIDEVEDAGYEPESKRVLDIKV